MLETTYSTIDGLVGWLQTWKQACNTFKRTFPWHSDAKVVGKGLENRSSRNIIIIIIFGRGNVTETWAENEHKVCETFTNKLKIQNHWNCVTSHQNRKVNENADKTIPAVKLLRFKDKELILSSGIPPNTGLLWSSLEEKSWAYPFGAGGHRERKLCCQQLWPQCGHIKTHTKKASPFLLLHMTHATISL